ncbi:hypothetical protein QF030_007272 [Streptomyces rishiriensis]|uniref:Uncharacterized protein n=1 Tax=Streptomyces rishiriensis TaxID=68264 RepID=A0ABU0P176_STRRH|nr:hypothetical protein [Streptomyces rishiriensis]
MPVPAADHSRMPPLADADVRARVIEIHPRDDG